MSEECDGPPDQRRRHRGLGRVVRDRDRGPAALHARIGDQDAEVMKLQLRHLAEIATLPGHEFGVVPFTAPSPVEPGSGFCVFDADLVVIETLGGDLQITDPGKIARYNRRIERLLDAAVTGEQAGELCRRLAAEDRR